MLTKVRDVYKRQNEHDAKSEDVVQLAHHVRQKVGEKFNVWLEPEAVSYTHLSHHGSGLQKR